MQQLVLKLKMQHRDKATLAAVLKQTAIAAIAASAVSVASAC